MKLLKPSWVNHDGLYIKDGKIIQNLRKNIKLFKLFYRQTDIFCGYTSDWKIFCDRGTRWILGQSSCVELELGAM